MSQDSLNVDDGYTAVTDKDGNAWLVCDHYTRCPCRQYQDGHCKNCFAPKELHSPLANDLYLKVMAGR